ncbi:serine/threonine-protein kinase [Trujillonella humicola]|uniref:serine/threonine-protein kinase n=1 Tax=Trujillonella humicola TaxID=3383699 RepID=UPI00390670AB
MPAQSFGPYRIDGLLGRGGMGEVYRAYDSEHRRVVALKVLSEHLASDPAFRERFRREAFLTASLTEPHVIPIHRYGELDGRLFLDMRLVDGEGLDALLARVGALPPEQAVRVLGQVAAALDAAHAAGLVHRDVKPSNILLTGAGEAPFAYLVDFGIARSTSDVAGPALTRAGEAIGSFEYMAPERFLGGPVTPAVDVYALACVLHECLTGRRAFAGNDLPSLMHAHLSTSAAPPSAVRPGIPAALDAVLAAGLAKDPSARPGARELIDRAAAAVDRAGRRAPAGTTVVLPPRQTPPPSWQDQAPAGGDGRRARGRAPLVVGAVLVAALGVGGALLATSLADDGPRTSAAGGPAGATPTTPGAGTATASTAAGTPVTADDPLAPAPVPTDAADPGGATGAENCFNGIITACDTLFQPRYDPVYVEYGSTCGGRAPATRGGCLEYFLGEPTPPEGLGSDAEFDELARACFEADWSACDELHERAESGSFYLDYGRHCGGRLPQPLFVYGRCTEIEG